MYKDKVAGPAIASFVFHFHRYAIIQINVYSNCSEATDSMVYSLVALLERYLFE